jgi:all-trans-retinol dehydrogenase (NAD+)
MSYFSGKRILITGVGSGLGRRMALQMARKGGHIIGWDYQAGALESVMAELKRVGGHNHIGYICDVSGNAAVSAAAEDVKKAVGTPDIVINNAGVVSGKRFLECSEQEIQRTMGVNTMSLFWTARAFLPGMIARNAGHLVTVASAAGLVGVAKLADYCASKFAAVGFDESIRAELKQIAPQVKTTVICPYYINTGMFDGVQSRFPWLLPILDEHYAVSRMVAAIERRRPRLIMPPLVFTIPLLRLLPVAVFDWVANFLGVNVSMADFKGRKLKVAGKK